MSALPLSQTTACPGGQWIHISLWRLEISIDDHIRSSTISTFKVGFDGISNSSPSLPQFTVGLHHQIPCSE
uniref:Uncharacterized protein n=1 Tax=Arion vulgaris TaxID=1028688 RepID=A0A0B7B2W1_9EUPU